MGGELGGWGWWRRLKSQERQKKESKRAQGPLVKHKGEERERTFEVRVTLQISTPLTALCKLAVRDFGVSLQVCL